MLRTFTRVLVLVLCAAVIGETLVLWGATGRSVFTYYYSEERAQQTEQTNDTASLFDDAGLNDSPQEQQIEPPPNRFMLGLFPSLTPDQMWRLWHRDLVSVMTLAGPAVAIALLTIVAMLRDRMLRRRSGEAEAAPALGASPAPGASPGASPTPSKESA